MAKEAKFTNELFVTYYYNKRHRGYDKAHRVCNAMRELGLEPDTTNCPESQKYVIHCTGSKPKLLELTKQILNWNEGEVEVLLKKALNSPQEKQAP